MTAGTPDTLERVSLAQTREEREAVYRLRYDVYMRELSKGFLTDVDHAHGWVRDPEDERDGVTIFYAGTADAMRGSLRVQVWEPGRVPEHICRRFSLNLFPGIGRYKVSEVARLIVRPDARGERVLASLACAAFEHVAARYEVFVCFAYCSPGLVRSFMRLGFRPYPGDLIPNTDGIRLPMLMTVCDLQHLQAIGSPLASLMARRFAASGAPPDLTPLLEKVARLPLHYETDADQIWCEVQYVLQPGPGTCAGLLEGITVEDAKVLCNDGIIMDIPADTVVMREGLVEQELYLVLDGTYEVRVHESQIAVLGKGDVLGEVSFFQNPGERVATVRSLAPGRVMVFERHFLERLIHSHPQLVCRLLLNLGRILSGHLAAALHRHIGDSPNSAGLL